MFRKKKRTPVEMTCCSFCGGEIHSTAIACRHCGASENDGWRDPGSDIDDEDDDYGDDEFDYDEYVRQNHPDENSPREIQWTGIPPLWRWTAVVLVLAFMFYLFGGLFF